MKALLPDTAVQDYCREISPYWIGVPERIAETVSGKNVSGSRGLRRLVVVTTTECNLSCDFCKVIARFEPRTLPFASVERRLRDAIALGVESIHFTGGECTTVHWIVEAVGMVASAGVKATLTTNGLGGSSMAEALAEAGIAKVNLSATALEPSMAGGRPAVGRAASEFATALSKAKKKRRIGFYVQVVLTNRNFRELPYLAERCLGTYDIDGMHAIPIRFDGERMMRREDIAAFYAEVLPETRRVAEKLRPDRVADIMWNLGRAFGSAAEDRMALGEGEYRFVLRTPCYMTFQELTLGADGRLYDCMLAYYDGAAPIGEDFERLSAVIDRCKTAERYEKRFPLYESCLKGCCSHFADFNARIFEAIGPASSEGASPA